MYIFGYIIRTLLYIQVYHDNIISAVKKRCRRYGENI